jgi:DNA replication protein
MKRNGLYSAVDFRYLLLDTYKKVGLTEGEVLVSLMVDHLLEQGNSLVTVDMLSLKMNLPSSEIDKIMVSLVKKGFLSYDTSDGKMKTSLSPLETRLYSEFTSSLEKEKSELVNKEKEDSLTELNAFFENKLGRSLSPLESSMISDWLEASFSVEQIKDALKDCLALGKKTIKAVDKRLREKRADADISKEGVSAVSSSWDKDIAETMKIAKKMWGDDDEKK